MKVKALGGLLSLFAVLSLALGTPAHASGSHVPPGGKKCGTTALAKLGLYVSPDTKLFITDKNGVVLKETLVAAVVIDAELVVCVQVDVAAFVDIGAAVPVDQDGDKKIDYVVSKVGIIGDVDGHAKISVHIKGKLGIFLAVKIVARVDVDVILHKGHKYECDAGAKK